jgi:amidohydrolase
MTTIEERKRRAREVVAAADADLRALSLAIHANPELGFEEHAAHDLLTGFFEERGFSVSRGICDLPTAFRAAAGSGSPTIAVFCEYDALPEIGHACGHNLIAAAGVATALGARAAIAEGEGTVVVLGSPAEEGGGGKVYLIERGALAGVDAALMLHPSPMDSATPLFNATRRLDARFHGRNAHAAARPWDGVNALDALVMAYNGIAVLRQQLPPDSRVHGVITKGGVRPNIIPDFTEGRFQIRAADDERLEQLCRRVLACFEGAATATGCRFEYEWVGRPYSNLRSNTAIADAYRANIAVLKVPQRPAPEGQGGGSTDMGNVSYVVPAIHPMFAIPTEAGNHTAGFTAAAATEQAHAAMLAAATALAMTAVDLFARPDLLAAAKAEFGMMQPAHR